MDRNVRLDLETNELNDEQLAQDLHHELRARREDSFDDLLKQNKVENEYNRPQTANAQERYYRELMNADHDFVAFEDENENLGENFEATPWLPPSIEKAKLFKTKAIFRNGDARIDSVELVSAPDLGIGTSLYFQFALTMAICLFVMSVFSLPALIFVFNGTAMPPSDQDVLGLYKYTLGNIGYNQDLQDYAEQTKCESSSYATGEVCLHINDNEISMTDAANIITAMEFLQIVTFFIGVVYLYMKSVSVTGRTAKSATCISDYTVMVTGIPTDTSDQELIDHFNKLYQLKEKDFMNRPALEDAQPVDNTGYTDEAYLRGTWIAECVVHKGIGGFISAFKSKQHILQHLYKSRARMKMYAENTAHSGGFNEKKFLSAKKDMLRTTAVIDKLTTANIKKTNLRFVDYKLEPNRKKINSNPQSVYYNINADSVAGFVTFDYAESLARCVRDYEKYMHFPMSLAYPEHLKFRGNKIKVVKAPEPDQIVWENLEVPFARKMYLRLRTNAVTLVLVVGCFIIILQASIYKNYFSSQIPDGKLCDLTIPQMYANNDNFEDFELVRPPTKQQKDLDAQCRAVVPDSVYLAYTFNGNWQRPVVTYSFSACVATGGAAVPNIFDPLKPTYATYEASVLAGKQGVMKPAATSTEGVCPLLGVDEYCPCAPLSLSTQCDGTDDNADFEVKDISSCYCINQLNTVIESGGVADTLNRINDLGKGFCKTFFQRYSLSVGLTYTSVLTTIIVNVLLRRFLKYLARQEAHTSSDEEQGSILSKIFLSNYATMAIIVLVAYGKAAKLPAFFKAIRVFDGVYEDFTPSWYGNIGFYLMTTFILQSFSPLLANLVMYYIIKPVLRQYHHQKVKENVSHFMVMQHDLNMLEVGPVFDPTDHTAQLLTLLFFAMTYAPGLPLLMPLCCFAFVLYFRVDKVLLCRYYQKPPQVGDAAIRNVIFFLPLAAIVRLAFACWMYGNANILPVTDNSASSSYDKFLKDIRDESGGYSFARNKLFRPNVFPLFMLLLIVGAGVVLRKLWRELPISWFFNMIARQIKQLLIQDNIFAMQTDDGKISGWDLLRLDDPLRQQSSGLTKEFFRYIKHRDEIPDTCYRMFTYAYLTKMTEIDVDEGWKLEDRGDFVVKVKIWREEHKRSDGTKAKVGTLKHTYEVIADHRCNTYNIEKVPAYYLAVRGIREGAFARQQGGGDAAGSGKAFFADARTPYYNELDVGLELGVKDKKPPQSQPDHAHGGHKGKVVVGLDLTSPSAHTASTNPPSSHPPTTKSANAPKTATQKVGGSAGTAQKNFTFDDFEGMEEGGRTALTDALDREERERQQREREREQKLLEAQQVEANKKKKKDKKKDKKGGH